MSDQNRIEENDISYLLGEENSEEGIHASFRQGLIVIVTGLLEIVNITSNYVARKSIEFAKYIKQKYEQ